MNFDDQVPIVIVGGGSCGLVAALAAHDAGIDAIVIERDRTCYGSSGMSLGALCAAGSAEQATHDVVDDAEAFLEDIMAKTRGRADPLVARTLAHESGPALDWLARSHNVHFELDRGWRPAFGHRRQRLHAVAERSGSAMMAHLVSACDVASILILNDARVETLASDDTGRVLGVELVRPDGARERIGCEAAIIATCGFGGNADMVGRHMSSMARARYFGWEGNRGDGILWGASLGAATGDMDAYQGLGLLAEPQGIDVNPKLLIEGGIQINTEGMRFSNEVEDVSGQGALVIAQPGGISWVVFDDRVHRACEALPQYRSLLELGAMKVGQDASSLADAIGIPADALQATLDETARAVRGEHADRFGRAYDRPPLVPGYRALRVTGALFHTQGGLVIDAEARVLRPDGTALPNLFAGGGAARGASGPGGSGYLPGMGLCAAITLGRVAGRAAARMVGSRRSTGLALAGDTRE